MKKLRMVLKAIRYFLVIFVASFTHVQLKAGERIENYNGVRSLGMGGVSAGVVNDETALLLNPAGMGKLRNAFVTLVDPEIHMGGEASGELLTGKGLGSLNTAQGILDKLNARPNRHGHFGYQLFPSLVLPNFGMGLLYKSFWDGQTNSDGSLADLSYRKDLALVLGYNISLLDGRIKLGFTGRYTKREESLIDDTSTASTGLSFETNKLDGTGLGLDGGIIFTAPWDTLPSLAVVIHDFGNTKYSIGGSSATDPETVKQTIDAAFSFFPIHANHIRSSFSFEYKDITNSLNEKDTNRRLHAGWELNMGDIFFLRAGYHQKQWTAGLEFATERAQFQFATYAEEVSDDNATTKLIDRRYVTKFVFRF